MNPRPINRYANLIRCDRKLELQNGYVSILLDIFILTQKERKETRKKEEKEKKQKKKNKERTKKIKKTKRIYILNA